MVESGERSEQYAVPYALGFYPEAGVPAPLLLQTEFSAFLVFHAVTENVEKEPEATICGIIEFERCTLTKFGHPNDEALLGHPLYSKGLGYYGVFEVHNSEWIKEKTAINRVCFPNTPDSKQRHFVFTFHDSTFECIASGMRARLSDKPYEEILAEITQKLLAS